MEYITESRTVARLHVLIEGKLKCNSHLLHPEEGGSKVLRNVYIIPHRYTASKLGYSSPWKPQISRTNCCAQ